MSLVDELKRTIINEDSSYYETFYDLTAQTDLDAKIPLLQPAWWDDSWGQPHHSDILRPLTSTSVFQIYLFPIIDILRALFERF